jgi:hypothetical protein
MHWALKLWCALRHGRWLRAYRREERRVWGRGR